MQKQLEIFEVRCLSAGQGRVDRRVACIRKMVKIKVEAYRQWFGNFIQNYEIDGVVREV